MAVWANLDRVSDIPPPPPGSQPPPPPPANLAPPPGYVAYGSAPTPTSRISRINGLSKGIVILVAIASIGAVVNAIAQSSLANKADDYLAGRISASEFDDSVLSFSAFSAVSGIATIAAAVLVMIWMYRITSNLRAFGHKTTWHPLFAVFGWFLPPFVLYIIPLLMLREQWKLSGSTQIAGQQYATGPDDQGTNTGENIMLWIWWALFGLLPLIAIGAQLDSFSGGFTDTSTDAVAERLRDTSSTLSAITTAGSVVAAVLWIVFVRKQTARHATLSGET